MRWPSLCLVNDEKGHGRQNERKNNVKWEEIDVLNVFNLDQKPEQQHVNKNNNEEHTQRYTDFFDNVFRPTMDDSEVAHVPRSLEGYDDGQATVPSRQNLEYAMKPRSVGQMTDFLETSVALAPKLSPVRVPSTDIEQISEAPISRHICPPPRFGRVAK